VTTPLPDLAAEGRRILDAGADTPLRLLGGLAVRVLTDDRPLLPRPIQDVDLFTARGRGPAVVELLERLGYEGDQRFNALNGHRRLLFHDDANGRRVDVFVGRFEMCHVLPLEERLTLVPATLPPAELLLTKLQVVAMNEKDEQDALSLLHYLPVTAGNPAGIDADRIAALTAEDWGLWRTTTRSLERVDEAASHHGLDEGQQQTIRSRIDELRGHIDERPKSLRWKARARVGERVRWYDEPEEVG
jgi:hypothetical protein